MESIAQLIMLALPVPVLLLFVGLGLGIHVAATEGRSRSAKLSRVTGVLNLLMLVPYGVMLSIADTGDVQLMFSVAALASASVGLLGLRMPARYSD